MEKDRVTLNEISKVFQVSTKPNQKVSTTAEYYIGPFKQVLTLNHLPKRGALQDQQLEVLTDAALLIKQGVLHKIFPWKDLHHVRQFNDDVPVITLTQEYVATPGLIDAHTHLCYAGTRAQDYADRLNGISYQQITARGGGIRDSMRATRQASADILIEQNLQRLNTHLKRGVTTVEIKSGYGLNVQDELKQLRAIHSMQKLSPQRLIATCLAAHVLPPEFNHIDEYLECIITELLPQVKQENLSQRVDIFVEPDAFPVEHARHYIKTAQRMGFDSTIHADQFVTGGVRLAAEVNAVSADHLEASTQEELNILARSECIPMALPGASLGLGCAFTPARQILDMGMSLAIASDWNPGSAPMGHLLLQASILGAHQKLSAAEVWAGMCIRAAHALNISQKVGCLATGYQADLLAFATKDYREILYQQGMLLPKYICCQGEWFTG
jgi:imidazolonepropionase